MKLLPNLARLGAEVEDPTSRLVDVELALLEELAIFDDVEEETSTSA